jgi:hypothetical protein
VKELSLVEGFSLMSSPGGANHQLRRAFNVSLLVGSPAA